MTPADRQLLTLTRRERDLRRRLHPTLSRLCDLSRLLSSAADEVLMAAAKRDRERLARALERCRARLEAAEAELCGLPKATDPDLTKQIRGALGQGE